MTTTPTWEFKEFCNALVVLQGQRVVCSVGLTADDDLPDTQEAFDEERAIATRNGRLIAVAPQMLGLLEEFVRAMNDENAELDTFQLAERLCLAAEPLIAKATGGTA